MGDRTMMKQLTTLVVVALVVTFTTSAFGRAKDKGAPKESPEMRAFTLMDANGDGKVDQKEFNAYQDARKKKARERSGAKGGKSARGKAAAKGKGQRQQQQTQTSARQRVWAKWLKKAAVAWSSSRTPS